MALAMRFRELTRPGDIRGRLGGGEFAIFLPQAPNALVQQIGARLSEGIHVVADLDVMGITVSIGASVTDGSEPFGRTMRLADDALVDAKRDGPSRIIVSTNERAA